jgi:hypothetical protein
MEQIAFLDGKDGTGDHRHGTGLQFEMIETTLQSDGTKQ